MIKIENVNRKQIPQGYKESPLGIIPADWDIRILGKILKEGRLGGNYENSGANTGVPLIKMGNLSRGKINLEKIEYLPIGQEYSEEDILKAGDLLFNTRNTLELVGKVAIWRRELPLALYNSNLLRLTFDTSYIYSNEFMNYVFNSHYGLFQLRKYATGTTSVAAIYSRDLQNMKVICPPLTEQQKIIEILTCWDKAIEKQSQLIDRLEIRKRGLMQQLLTGKKRIKGFDEVWKKVALRELFNRITRKNAEGNTNVVTISAQRGFVRQSDFFTKNVASQKLDDYFIVNKGDFCYNKSYSKGYPWGAIKRLKDFEKAVVTTLYICFEIKDTTLSSGDFFEQYFEANILDKGLTQVAYEGGRAHGLLNVTPTDFFSLKIWVPLIVEQVAIANILSTADSEIQAQKEKLTALKSQKKGLMQQLLTGKKRVVNPIII